MMFLSLNLFASQFHPGWNLTKHVKMGRLTEAIQRGARQIQLSRWEPENVSGDK